MLETGRLGPLEWPAAGRPLPGHEVSGDHSVVVDADGQALVVVVDGLGHGGEAASAARRATGTVAARAGEPLDALCLRCHEALVGTRGCAMTLVRIGLDDGRLSWLGVGNVAATLLRRTGAGSLSRQSALLRGGVVGQQLPLPLVVRTTQMLPGDLLLVATDGVRNFDADPELSRPTGQLAEQILQRCASSGDDALVVAVRDRGASR